METLFRKYHSFVSYAVLRLLPDPQMAEDIAQEVFFEVWRRRESLLITTSLRAYLRRSAVNRTLNHLRDNKNRRSEELTDTQLNVQTPPSQSLETEELQEIIRNAIEQLPDRCGLVFKMSRLEEKSYQEIADYMGISVKTVENQIVKALKVLRETLRPFMDRNLLIAWLISWFF